MQKTNYRVESGGCLKGECTVPGDKSISHRAIMLGALAQGVTEVEGFLQGLDCLKTCEAFQAMGVRIEGIREKVCYIHGVGMQGLSKPSKSLDVGNAGTSMRLLTGILSAQSFDSVLTGDLSLRKRPMTRVIDPLTQMGARIESDEGMAPLRIRSVRQLHGIDYQSPIASAQVKSCVLLAGMYAEGETVVIEPGVSRDHSERMLSAFSYPIKKSGHSVSIHGGGELIATNVVVPGDLSSATFFIVGATLSKGSDLLIKNVGINPTRIGVIHILNAMGADIQLIKKRLYGDEQVADIWVRYAPLYGIDIPQEWVSLAIDEFPAIFVAASVAEGQTVLKGAKELKVKESDRIVSMVEGLNALGINAISLNDGAVIHGGEIKGGEVNSAGDHRVAMAFAMAGLRSAGRIKINDVSQVATSFPGFSSLAKRMGLKISE